MKTKKAFDVCKKSGAIWIYSNPIDETEWIANGFAAYYLGEMPTLTEDYICKMYDITDSQRLKISFRFFDELPPFNISDTDESETSTTIFDMSIVADGDILLPIATDEGLMFIQQKLLAPLTDIPMSELQIYKRLLPNGNPYFAVKIGMLLFACIAPIDVVNEKFVNKLKYLYSQSKMIIANKFATNLINNGITQEREENEMDNINSTKD